MMSAYMNFTPEYSITTTYAQFTFVHASEVSAWRAVVGVGELMGFLSWEQGQEVEG